MSGGRRVAGCAGSRADGGVAANYVTANARVTAQGHRVVSCARGKRLGDSRPETSAPTRYQCLVA